MTENRPVPFKLLFSIFKTKYPFSIPGLIFTILSLFVLIPLITVLSSIYKIQAPAIMYMHPNQVHRLIKFDNATVSSWIITNEMLRPELLQQLEDIAPVVPANCHCSL